MKFRNPWIDPRIAQASPDDAQAYLTQHGWKPVGPASDPELLRYEMEGKENAPTLFVPIRVGSGAGLQWMIDLVADLAHFEDRWAVEVLHDILRKSTEAAPSNGPAVAPKAEPLLR